MNGRETAGRKAMHWAVALLILATAGCSSRAAMQRMQDQLDYLEASQRRMERDMMRLDSLSSVSASESRRTRAEVSTTLEDFQRDTQAMRESVDELRRSIERRPRLGTGHVDPLAFAGSLLVQHCHQDRDGHVVGTRMIHVRVAPAGGLHVGKARC